MTAATSGAENPRILYPESNGQPVSENTLQFMWVVLLQGGLDAQFRDDPNVFVAGDLFWYPMEGGPKVRMAPDVMVVFGRPKGYRGSYQQWREHNAPPQVVFEVLSPKNTLGELLHKLRFYERYGVEEFYIYDPNHSRLEGWLRSGSLLQELPEMDGWVSPRLGTRFDLSSGELQIFGPDGRRFLSYVELAAERDQEHQARRRAEQQLERVAAQLRALGVEPEAG
jgi:Uma2 family endonuclease